MQATREKKRRRKRKKEGVLEREVCRCPLAVRAARLKTVPSAQLAIAPRQAVHMIRPTPWQSALSFPRLLSPTAANDFSRQQFKDLPCRRHSNDRVGIRHMLIDPPFCLVHRRTDWNCLTHTSSDRVRKVMTIALRQSTSMKIPIFEDYGHDRPRRK